jgi:hypothetical protein
MSKLLKKIGIIIADIFEWLLIVTIFLAFLVRTSTFQTFLAKQATSFLSKELNTKFHVDRVSIVFFNRVALDGVFVLDQQKDTLASIETIFVTLNSFNQQKNLLSLREANIKNGIIKISRAAETGDYNYWFIQDYFDTGPSTKETKPIDVKLRTLKLTKVRVHYDDYRKSYSDFGMDYDHLKFNDVYLSATNFSSENGEIKALIKHLSFYEKSGFVLGKFSTNVSVSNEGLKLNNLKIQTPNSMIHAPKLSLLLNEMEDFEYFEDSVVLEARLNKSIVSFQDISYFATALEGMDEVVRIEADVNHYVKNLAITNLNLEFGKHSKLQGAINLPDFRDFEQAVFKENLTYAFISFDDLQAIKMPKDAGSEYIQLDKMIQNLKHVEVKNMNIDGKYNQFVVSSSKINTYLGGIRLDKGVLFTENKQAKTFDFNPIGNADYIVKIDSFQLGKFLSNSSLGIVDGSFNLDGQIYSSGNVNFNHINGKLNSFDLLKYRYHDVTIANSSFKDNVFEGFVDVHDKNLLLCYDGKLDLNKNQHFDFNLEISKANLVNLKFTNKENSSVTSSFSIDIKGNDLNNYYGTISLKTLNYAELDKTIDVPWMNIKLDRGENIDYLTIESKIFNLKADGKVDYKTIGDDFNRQFSSVFPAIFSYEEKELKKSEFENTFNYTFEAKNMNEFLDIFVPGLETTKGTKITGKYDGNTDNFSMILNSPYIRYNNIKATGIVLNQQLINDKLLADYSISTFALNDSLRVYDVTFNSFGVKDQLDSKLKWNPNTTNESNFVWRTVVGDMNNYFFYLDSSYFSIKEHLWNIKSNSQIIIAEEDITIDKFLMSRDNQYISLDGCLSKNSSDFLKIDIHDFQLDDFGALLGIPFDIRGEVNGIGEIANPFDDLRFRGNASVSSLFLDKNEVGDVNINGSWDKLNESIDLKGDLLFRKNKTFVFTGNYFLNREKDNLNFDLDFDRTDIRFANAFLDPNVVSGIRGLLDGKVKVKGTVEKPEIQGRINLLGGNAKVEMFGVNFGFNGEIYADEYGIYIDNMPVIDEEGNSGSLIGTVYHDNFTDWNFDLAFNLEDDFYNKDPKMPWRSLPLDRFLVMNTQYKEGELYYGKAYSTGRANISGYADNLNITVNLKTQRGTSINFPMYGTSDIEEDNFITFVSRDTATIETQTKIDFTGVNLDLNFNVTQEAKIKLIFDEKIGDEISATGNGNLSINLDNLGDIKMNGTFVVKDGVYNFAMGPIKQNFYIQEGGQISWTGDPYNANLDIKTFHRVNANLGEIMDAIDNQRGPTNQEVLCYLNLSQTLIEPKITFDIQVPKATEGGRAALNRVKSDQDELNRQFFSLLLWKKFQPLQGQTSASGNAALDMVSNQINSVLSQVSKDYKLNVALDNDKLTTTSSYEVGISKNFLDDRLIIKGSLGVESHTEGSTQSNFIGDVNVEYVLNESGTFRVSIFNESNDYAVIQDRGVGQFTQGVGINYQEEFQTFRESKMLQYTLDIFRKKQNKHFKDRNKHRQKRVPTQGKQEIIKPEEE